MAGVYISYPFCAQKCTYCNFASGVFPAALEAEYLRALEAEIAAASAVLALARDTGIARMRLHTDCKALVHLWLNQRDDPRLATLRAQARHLDRVHMRLIPRRHNQAAHRLSHAAAHGTDILDLDVKAKQMQPAPADDSGESSIKNNA